MSSYQNYVASITLPVSARRAFAYHDRRGALQRLIPPWETMTVEHSDESLEVGSEVQLKTSLMGVPLRLVAKHTRYEPPRLFEDQQESGPFAYWKHRHEFAASGDEYSTLTDRIEYQLPLGAVGKWFGSGIARRKIESMFAYRHRVVRDDLELLRKYPFESPLKVAVSGSSGMVGRSLCNLLILLGHDVIALVRSPESKSPWPTIAPWSDGFSPDQLSGLDAVIHLAGKPIAEGRWSEATKEQIRNSRVEKTRSLCESLASLTEKPKTLICASATGIYGDRGDEILTEDSETGDGFLADVARQWEESCREAADAGIRVVNARLGIVLSPTGGALAKTLTPAKLLGGKLGSGRQWWSWIGLDDCLGALYHALMTPSVHGPVNLVAPSAIENADFVKTLGAVIGRPAIFPAPAFALRLALGEMADALLLASTQVQPTRLLQSGYEFRFTELADSLSYQLGYEYLESSE